MAKGKTTKATDAPLEEELLDANAILDAEDITTKVIGPIPDWGGKILVKLMDANAAERWGKAAAEKNATSVSSAISLVRQCACNPDGSPMFTSKAMLERLATKSMRAIRYVSDECIKFNGLDGNRRRQLAAMLRTRTEAGDLTDDVNSVLLELATELDGETTEEAAKNA